MLDGLRGTELEHRALLDSIRYRMRPQLEQARDIAVAVSIKTIGGACQSIGKRLRSGIKI